MPNTDIKQLLVRLNISTSGWLNTVKDISRRLEEERKKEAKAADVANATVDKQVLKLKESIDVLKQRTKETESQVKQETKLREASERGLEKLKQEINALKEKSREQQLALKDQNKLLLQQDSLVGKLKEKLVIAKQTAIEQKKETEELEKQSRWANDNRRLQAERLRETAKQAQLAKTPKTQAAAEGPLSPKTGDIAGSTTTLAAARAKLADLKKQLAEEEKKDELASQKKIQNLEKQISKQNDIIRAIKLRSKESETQLRTDVKITDNAGRALLVLREQVSLLKEKTKEGSKLSAVAEQAIDKLRKEIVALKDKTKEQQTQIKDQTKQLTQHESIVTKLKEKLLLHKQISTESRKHTTELESQGRWTEEARRKQSELLKARYAAADIAEQRIAMGPIGRWTEEARKKQSEIMKERFRVAQFMDPTAPIQAQGEFSHLGFSAHVRAAYMHQQNLNAAKQQELKVEQAIAAEERKQAQLKEYEIKQAERLLRMARDREAAEQRISKKAATVLPTLENSAWMFNEKGRQVLKPGWTISKSGVPIPPPLPPSPPPTLPSGGGGGFGRWWIHPPPSPPQPSSPPSLPPTPPITPPITPPGGGGGGGIFGGAGAFISGMAGGAVVALAQTVTNALQRIGQKVIQTIRDIVSDAGPLLNTMQVFENLAERAGTTAEKWGADLRNATEGLVDDTKIIQFASTILRENTGLSTESITELVNVTQRFARVTGKDPVEALTSLNRALQTGRLSMLGYQYGLDPATKDLLELTDGLERHDRIATQTAILQEEMQRQLRLTGEPVKTVTEYFKEFSVWLNNVYESVVKYIGKSQALNTSLEATTSLGRTLISVLKAVWEAFNTLGELAAQSSGGLFTWDREEKGASALEKVLAALGVGIELVNYSVERITLSLEALKVLLTTPFTAEWGTVLETLDAKAKEAQEKLAAIEKGFDERISVYKKKFIPQELQDAFAPKEPPKTEEDIQDDLRTQQERRKLRLDVEKEAAEQELALAKIVAQKKKEISEDLFKYGKQGLRDYVAAQNAAAEEEFKAERTKILKLQAIEQQQLAIEAYGTIENARIAAERPERIFVPGKKDAEGKDIQKRPEQIYQFDDEEKQAAKRSALAVKTNAQITQAEEKLRQDIKRNNDLILKDQFDATRRRVDAEIEASRTILDQRLRDAEAEYQLKKINKERLDAIKLEVAGEREDLDVKEAFTKMVTTPGWQDIDSTARAEFAAASNRAGRTREQTEKEIQLGIEQEERQVLQRRAQTEIDIARSANETIQRFYEFELENRRMTIEQVLDLRRDGIEKEADLQRKEAENTKAFAQDNINAEEEYQSAILKINQATANKLAEFDRDRADAVSAYTQRIFNIEMNRLDAKIRAGESEGKVLQEQIDLTEKYISDIMHQAFVTKHLSEAEAKRKEELDKILAILIQLKSAQYQFMGAVSDTQAIFGNLFESIGGNSEKGFGSIIRSLGEGLRTASSISAAIQDYQAAPIRIAHEMSENAFVGLGQSLGELFLPEKKEGTDEAQRTSTERLKAFNLALQTVTQSLVGIYQIFQARSGAQGAVTGASVGASVGSIGGPIGAAIGAGVGAAVGFFTGNARKKTEEAANNMVKAFNKITQAFEMGEVNLRNTIKATVEQRQKTVEALSGKKGGREELDKLLPQVDQQIAQLKKQQKQITDQLQEEINVLSSPVGLQQYVSDLTEIIAKYKQFEGAIEDTSKAQEYLRLTLQAYIRDQKDVLTDAQHTAIQDAIRLNELLEARIELLTEAGKREFDIRTAGALTRQRTVAQTKMGDIEELRKNLNKQLEQIDKEIALTKFKVDMERELFSIATERVSLESQLVAMQKEVITQDIERIKALQTMIIALERTGGSITGINQLLAAVPKGSGNTFTSLLEGAYGNYGRNGYSGFNAE